MLHSAPFFSLLSSLLHIVEAELQLKYEWIHKMWICNAEERLVCMSLLLNRLSKSCVCYQWTVNSKYLLFLFQFCSYILPMFRFQLNSYQFTTFWCACCILREKAIILNVNEGIMEIKQNILLRIHDIRKAIENVWSLSLKNNK